MSNNPTTTVQTDYTVIAEAVETAAKAYAKVANASDGLVSKVGESIYLAFTTGYVFNAKSLTADQKTAEVAAGRISSGEFAKMFVSKAGNTPDPKTIKHWWTVGAAIASGADAATIKALTNRTKAMQVFASLGGAESMAELVTAETLTKALDAEPEKRSAQPDDGSKTSEPEKEITPLQALVTVAALLTADVVAGFSKADTQAFFAAVDTLTESGAAALNTSRTA